MNNEGDNDIEFWKKEIRSLLILIKQNLENLSKKKSELSDFTASINTSLVIVLTCINHRSSRVDIDTINDDISEALLKEKHQLLKMKTSLENFVFEVISLLHQGAAVKRILERDMTLKIYPFLSRSSTASSAKEDQQVWNKKHFDNFKSKLKQNTANGLEFPKNVGKLSNEIENYLVDAKKKLSKQKVTVDEIFLVQLQVRKENLDSLKSSYGNVLTKLNELEFGSKYDLEMLKKENFSEVEKEILADSASLSDTTIHLTHRKISLEKEIKTLQATIHIDEEFCIPVRNLSKQSDF